MNVCRGNHLAFKILIHFRFKMLVPTHLFYRYDKDCDEIIYVICHKNL